MKKMILGFTGILLFSAFGHAAVSLDCRGGKAEDNFQVSGKTNFAGWTGEKGLKFVNARGKSIKDLEILHWPNGVVVIKFDANRRIQLDLNKVQNDGTIRADGTHSVGDALIFGGTWYCKYSSN